MIKVIDYFPLLKEQFNNRISLKEKREGIIQVFAPLYHEDGDMMEIFLEELPTGKIKICDHGMTLMRLSYSFDLNTENKNKIFRSIIEQNGAGEENGNIFLEVDRSQIFNGIMQFARIISIVSNMNILKREMIKNLFYEMLDEFVQTDLRKFNPIKSFAPLEEDIYMVDYKIEGKEKPLYLFGVKDSAKARLVTINCLTFIQKKISFRSVAIHENFDDLPQKDKSIITNVVDKQFTSFDEFQKLGPEYFEREIA